MIKYCDNCEKKCETKIKQITDKFKVCDVEIEATITVRVCNECGEEVWDKEIEKKNDIIIFDEYKKAKNLLTSQDLKIIREKYSLSQVSFSKLLGFGEKTITRYENGAIQDISHDLLIRLMQKEFAFKEIWDLRKDKLSLKENKIIEKILVENEAIMKPFNYVFTLNNNQMKSIYTKNMRYGGLKYAEC